MCDDLANATLIKNKSAKRKCVNFTKPNSWTISDSTWSTRFNNTQTHTISWFKMYAGTCRGNVLLMILQYIPGSTGWLMVSWCYWVSQKPCLPLRRESFVFFCFFFGVGGGGWFGFIWGTGSFRLRWREAGGGRGWCYAGSSPSRMVLRRPGGGNVNLRLEPSLHLGDEEGEWAAQREGGRWLAGRAGRRKQESRGGATGERGRSCQWQGGVRVRGGGQSVGGKVGGVLRSKREWKRGK